MSNFYYFRSTHDQACDALALALARLDAAEHRLFARAALADEEEHRAASAAHRAACREAAEAARAEEAARPTRWYPSR